MYRCWNYLNAKTESHSQVTEAHANMSLLFCFFYVSTWYNAKLLITTLWRYLLFQLRAKTFRPKYWSVPFCHISSCLVWFIMWHWWFTFKHLIRLQLLIHQYTDQVQFTLSCGLKNKKNLPRIISLQKRIHQLSYHISDVWILQVPYNGLLVSDAKQMRQ